MRRVPLLLLTLLLAGLFVFLLWLGWTLTHPEVSQPLIFSPDQLPAARMSQSYSATITISNNLTPVGDISVPDGALPRGLILHHTRGSSTADISGIPAESGDFKFTISAWCFGTNVSGQTGQQAYSLTVK